MSSKKNELFKFEREMTDLVSDWLMERNCHVKRELKTDQGVCDLVGCVWNEEAILQRIVSGPKKPLGSRLQVALWSIAASKKKGVRQDYLLNLFKKSSISSHLIKNELDKLVKNKAVVIDNDFVEADKSWYPHYEKIIAVELKLHRSNEALAQAIRYKEFSTESWVAMPLNSAKKVINSRSGYKKFCDNGVGLLGVARSNVTSLIEAYENDSIISDGKISQFRVAEMFWRTVLQTPKGS